MRNLRPESALDDDVDCDHSVAAPLHPLRIWADTGEVDKDILEVADLGEDSDRNKGYTFHFMYIHLPRWIKSSEISDVGESSDSILYFNSMAD